MMQKSYHKFERKSGIWLEHEVYEHLIRLKEQGIIQDFFYNTVLHSYQKNVIPDFIVLLSKVGRISLDIIECKDWNTDLVFSEKNIMLGEYVGIDNLLSQMHNYEIGIMHDPYFRNLMYKRGRAIVVTTARMYKQGIYKRPIECATIPIVSRRRDVDSSKVILANLNVELTSFQYFRSYYPS